MSVARNWDVLDHVLDSISDGVYAVDRSRKIVYWSEGAERITGYRAADVIGSRCCDNVLRHVDGRGTGLCTGMCPLMKAVRLARTARTRMWLHHKDGHRVPVLVRTFPARDKRGRIRGAWEVFSDVSPPGVLKERLRDLERLSLLDPLTGLANRRFLGLTMRARIAHVRRGHWKVGIIFVDIDNFKTVNDTWGHDTGDKVLKMVARNLLGNSRSFDLVGRWGGDEFVVVCENASLPVVRRIAERYRALVASSSTSVSGGRIHLTLSAGVTLIKAGDTVTSLVLRADRLMYRGKKAGKNKVAAG